MALHEECGVFGVFGDPDAAHLTYYGLHSLQHRGQEAAGIAVARGQELYLHKGEGLVSEVFAKGLRGLDGRSAIGHVRYSTNGGGGYENVQPLLFRSGQGDMAIAHNGELVNALDMKLRLEAQGSIFQTTSDTELLAHMIRRSLQTHFRDKVRDALRTLIGGFAFVILTPHELIAALDQNGLRPLCLGQTQQGGYVLSSESCAFDIIGAQHIRDVEPGEMIVIDHTGLHSDYFDTAGQKQVCSMEYIYFSRPDSILDGVNVHAARKQLGKVMASEAPVEADIVIGVPDSSTSAAIGYAEASGIPYEMGLIKNRYVGRTFIQPSQEMRERGVKMKLSAVRSIVAGKRLVILDDSIVRGTTMRRIVSLLRQAGAKEVHLRISSPPIMHPCHYGIDMHSYEELISASMDPKALQEYMGADSLVFLSVEGLLATIGNHKIKNAQCGRCVGCFTGNYPTPVNLGEDFLL